MDSISSTTVTQHFSNVFFSCNQYISSYLCDGVNDTDSFQEFVKYCQSVFKTPEKKDNDDQNISVDDSQYIFLKLKHSPMFDLFVDHEMLFFIAKSLIKDEDDTNRRYGLHLLRLGYGSEDEVLNMSQKILQNTKNSVSVIILRSLTLRELSTYCSLSFLRKHITNERKETQKNNNEKETEKSKPVGHHKRFGSWSSTSKSQTSELMYNSILFSLKNHSEQCQHNRKSRLSLRGNKETLEFSAYETMVGLSSIRKNHKVLNVDHTLISEIISCSMSSNSNVSIEAMRTLLWISWERAFVLENKLRECLPDTASRSHIYKEDGKSSNTTRSIIGKSIKNFKFLNNINTAHRDSQGLLGMICAQFDGRSGFDECLVGLLENSEFSVVTRISLYIVKYNFSAFIEKQRVFQSVLSRIESSLSSQNFLELHTTFRIVEKIGIALFEYEHQNKETFSESVTELLQRMSNRLYIVINEVTNPLLIFSGIKAFTWIGTEKELNECYDKIFSKIDFYKNSWRKFHISGIFDQLVNRSYYEKTILNVVEMVVPNLCIEIPELICTITLSKVLEKMVHMNQTSTSLSICQTIIGSGMHDTKSWVAILQTVYYFLSHHVLSLSVDTEHQNNRQRNRYVPKAARMVMLALMRASIAERGEIRLQCLEGLGNLAVGTSNYAVKLEVYSFVSRLAKYPSFGVEGFCANIANRLDAQLIQMFQKKKEDKSTKQRQS